eukprot:TRINITY_DN21471_c0_g1_i1.p1 TRINITY_DN21471_c0_g1~~TRINITY_DN21471_c0_g1_i1.p1  ORF type:complete len:706 (+),score=217.56 TRINITY_DN21471_c0_g1_i1:87-2204(+)
MSMRARSPTLRGRSPAPRAKSPKGAIAAPTRDTSPGVSGLGHSVRRERRNSYSSYTSAAEGRRVTRRSSISPTPAAGIQRMRDNRAQKNTTGGETEAVRVVLRVRPFNTMEDIQQQGARPCLLPSSDDLSLLTSVSLLEKRAQFKEELEEECSNTFQFDKVFYPSELNGPSHDVQMHEQNEVYDKIGTPCLTNLFDSYNSCVFAYGQTGSGKTHTMMGSADVEGIIPRFCKQLLSRYEELPPLSQQTIKLQASFVEIYCENLYDLMSPEEVKKQSWVQNGRHNDANAVNRKKLALRQHPVHGLTVAGAQSFPVSTWNEVDAVLRKGMAARSTAATSMNDQSSRSHAMFQITMEMSTQRGRKKQEQTFSTATIRFVDLAGSENLKKSGSDGARMHESIHINTSLLSLRRVIDQLLENKAMPAYRDSKLTRLLSDCLGGNSKTWFLACVSPSVINLEETKNTLRYAAKATRIVNHVKRNMDVGDRLEEDLIHLKEELALARGGEVDELKTLITQYERTQADMVVNMELLQSKQEEAERAVKEAELQAELKVKQLNESSQRARAVHTVELEKMQQGLKQINSKAESYKQKLEREEEQTVAAQRELEKQKEIAETRKSELRQMEEAIAERERRAAEEKRAWEELTTEMEGEMEKRLAKYEMGGGVKKQQQNQLQLEGVGRRGIRGPQGGADRSQERTAGVAGQTVEAEG